MPLNKNDIPVRVFKLVRNEDETGVSGTGCILEGVQFHNGQVAVCWRTDVEGVNGNGHGWSSLGIYPNWEAFEAIHIAAHPDNKSEVHWYDMSNLSKRTIF